MGFSQTPPIQAPQPTLQLPMPSDPATQPMPLAPVPQVPSPLIAQEAIARELLPPTTDALTLADVYASLYQSYPTIQQARLQAQLTAGERQSATGWWDPKLEAYSLSQPLGFYRNYRQGIGLSRNLWWGGYLSSGYRIGRGEFQPWYKERETNEGGELKIGWVQPLLQGRAIDPGRVALFQAQISQQQVGPLIQREILDSSGEAADVYWSWVAAGQLVRIQEEMLRLAQIRVGQIEKLVDAGDEKAATRLFNEQLIAERQLKLLENIRKFREKSFKLSLFLRDENGQPLVPEDSWLPPGFPPIGQLPPGDFQNDLSQALSRRPELRLLELDMQQSQWDLRLARNQILPQLDIALENSQDMGRRASSLGDKSPYEMELGVQGSVPLPRNKARGKVQSTQAKIGQIAQKRELQSNKIGVELQTTRNALQIATERVMQANKTADVALRYLALAEKGYQEGEGDLVDLNILEEKAYSARTMVMISYEEWFAALAGFQIALGLDPLDQAMQLADALETMRINRDLSETVAPQAPAAPAPLVPAAPKP